MNYVVFGKTGMRVSRLALGGVIFGTAEERANWRPATSDGRRTAIETIHCALDLGINYLDTAPSYGDGLSEIIYGEALKGKRKSVLIASKVGMGASAKEMRSSVENSLRRLQTDYLDVIQLHGGTYSPDATKKILKKTILTESPIEALESLKVEGKIRYIGFTSNENKWPCLDLIESGRFDMCQLQYNLMNQAAAYYTLPTAAKQGLGVTVMRPLTSGTLLDIVSALAPEWHASRNVFEVALKFLLSDSRVHVVNTGMRYRHEVEMNVEIVNTFEPRADFANLKRSVGRKYRA